MVNIIFQAWQTFNEFNQTDLAGLFAYPANTWSGFIPLVLFGLCMIVMLATFFSQERIKGRGDIFSSFAVATWFTAVIATLMTTMDIVNSTMLLIVYGVAVAALGLLAMTRER